MVANKNIKLSMPGIFILERIPFRDWSLITEMGAIEREGDGMSSCTSTKRVDRKSLSHAEAGAEKVLG